jgi:solute carrier family 25 carnitine/acylcarnitine transporter 20/29
MTISEAWVDFIAGWASGGVAVLTCQPVDTVLTRLQAGEALVAGNVNGSSNTIAVQTRGLIANAGMASLWRGSSAMISAVPLQNALLMGGYGVGKQWASENSKEEDTSTITLVSVFVGGCSGGVIQSFLMSPVELMKVNQQVIGKSAKLAGRELVKGWNSSSWRGLNATLLRDGVPHGVWFLSYEWCKTDLLGKRLKGTTGEQVTVPLASGAFAATVAWVS